MFPVPERAKQLEQDWADELASHFGCTAADFRANPAKHLNYPVQRLRVELMDGSVAEFKYAFALVSEKRKAIAVFTEHCGHHVFPYHEARVLVNGEVIYEQHAV